MSIPLDFRGFGGVGSFRYFRSGDSFRGHPTGSALAATGSAWQHHVAKIFLEFGSQKFYSSGS